MDKAREPRSLRHLRSVFLPEKGLSSGGCSVYTMPLHIRLEGAVDDQPSLQSSSSPLREPEPTRAASPSSLATQPREAIKLPDLPSPGGTAEGPPMQRPRTPASALAVERARARQTFRGKPERQKREPRTALHTPKAKKPSHRMWSCDDPRFCEGTRQPDWALRLPSAGTMDACFLDASIGLLEASSTIARPATAARALSDFERLPVPDDNGFFPASPQSGARRCPWARAAFRRPARAAQARRSFPPARAGLLLLSGFRMLGAHHVGDALVLDIHRARLARRRHFPFGALVEPRRTRPQSQLGLALLAPVLRKVLHARASYMSAHADHVAHESTGRERDGGPPVVRN